MNYLVLTVGAPGSGKSTLIDKLGWTPYTICPDMIRLEFQSPILDKDGRVAIGQDDNRKVWQHVHALLEYRMQKGNFTVIDATHTSIKYFSNYKKLASKYGYRMYAIDFRGTKLQTCINNNNRRINSHKYVPESILKNMYLKCATLEIPNYIITLPADNPNKILETLKYNIHDYNQYDHITIIGDIHGCVEPLLKIEGFDNPKHLFIYIGDYVDRGVNNGEVMQHVLKTAKLPNVIQLKGNHERHLEKWANDETPLSDEFNNHTAPQLEALNISKKDVRRWYKGLVPVSYFTFNEKRFLITHGGLSAEPDNLLLLSDDLMIKGVGRYEDMLDVNKSFLNNTDSNVKQVHGHRNIERVETQINDRCYNLEGQVEFGGYLRTLNINKHPFYITEQPIPNSKVKPNIIPISEFNPQNNREILSQLMSSRDIKTRIQEDNSSIVSFNFTKNVFYKQRWDEFNVRARGLFVNINTGKVVARSYNKFFNINERPETKMSELKNKLKYPVTAYQKENGFLGLIGYDEESDNIVITSKSLTTGEFVEYFKTAINETGLCLDCIYKYVKEHNVGLIFEVVDPKRDPHIITNIGIRIILLDIVDLNFTYKNYDYDELYHLSQKINCSAKIAVNMLENFDELTSFIKDHKEDETEGFVFVDSSNFMVKYKTDYYNYWKRQRTQINRIKKGLALTESTGFALWAEYKFKQKLLDLDKVDIPKLRYLFEHKALL